MEEQYCHQIIIGVYASGIGSYMKTDYVIYNDNIIFNKIFQEEDTKGHPIVYINVKKDIPGFELWKIKKDLTNEFLNICLKRRKEAKKWMLERLDEMKEESISISVIDFLESIDIEATYKGKITVFIKKESLIKIFGREDVGILNVLKMLEREFQELNFISSYYDDEISIQFFPKRIKE